MADIITGNTQLAPTKQDIIAAVVQKELKFAAKLLPYVTDVSIFAGKGAKTVSFPKLTSFTVVNRASGVAGDASALTASVDQLALDKNAYVAWLIDSTDEVQSTIQAQVEFARRAAAAHGRYVDEQIIAVLDAAAGLDVGAAPITRDYVLDMREFLLKNDADMNQVVLAIGPDQEKAMLKISEFTQAQIYGGAVIPSGVIGSVYGIPVLVHNGISTGKAFMWEKSGVALAFQMAPNMTSQGANEYGSASVRYAMDQKFGVAALQLGEKGLLGTQSPLIAEM